MEQMTLERLREYVQKIIDADEESKCLSEENRSLCKGILGFCNLMGIYNDENSDIEEESETEQEDENTDDAVNHPNHYTQGGIECIDEMVAVFGEEVVMNFCLCNVWKYRKRALYKNGKEDLEKADWYMKKYLELQDL